MRLALDSRFTPVATFSSSTAAAGTEAPDGSSTTPTTCPSVAWPKANGEKDTKSGTINARIIFLCGMDSP